MLSKTGFAKDHRAISIQDQAQIRNLDSEKGMPRFDSFKIQFYSSILDTFSTDIGLHREGPKCDIMLSTISYVVVACIGRSGCFNGAPRADLFGNPPIRFSCL